MNKTAIVFGATGLVGKELIFELLEHSAYLKVKAVVRKKLPFSNAKLEQVIVSDFTNLESISGQLAADAYFCCIGTTIKKAGSQDAFRKVDLDIPVAVARLAKSMQVPNMVVISSIGANAQSNNFYLKTKGIMEQEVRNVYPGNLKILRPSFLLGNREEFRLGEKIGIIVARVLGPLMIGGLAKYRGIESWNVARAMILSMDLPAEKLFIESDELQIMVKRDKTSGRKSWEVIK